MALKYRCGWVVLSLSIQILTSHPEGATPTIPVAKQDYQGTGNLSAVGFVKREHREALEVKYTPTSCISHADITLQEISIFENLALKWH